MNLIEGKISIESEDMEILLLEQIETTVLNEPNVADCAVLIRRTDETESINELVVYFVPQGPVNEPQLYSRLSALLDVAPPPIRCVPLLKLPLAADGSPNYQALAAIPILDDKFIDQSEQILCRQAGIKKAAVVRMRDQAPKEMRYHLDDLVSRTPVSPAQEDQLTTSHYSTFDSEQGLEPASVFGGDLDNREKLATMNLLDLMREAVEACGNQKVRFFLANGELLEWNYAELWSRAERIHAGLMNLNLQPGDKVVFQMQGNPNILSAFWACQMAGLVPVIVEVPTNYETGNQGLERLLGLLQLLKNPLVITDQAIASIITEVHRARFAQDLQTASIEELKTHEAKSPAHKPNPDDIAFFNLSSGSTGTPKCIMLSHRNILARAFGTNQLCGFSNTDVILNWLPFDHIGSISDWHLRCLVLRCELIYVDKEYVIANPINWLNLIDRFRVTHSWSPNFAFSLINKQLELSKAPSWDLSCVKCLLTAGEAVSDNSVQQFISELKKFRLSPYAVQPAFGMAELGSGVSYFVPSEINPLRFHTLRKPSMGKPIERVEDDHPDASRFADLGPPIPGVSFRIVDNEGNLLPLESVGRLEISGDVVFHGYYENPSANASAFPEKGWFNTGDLGFLAQGNLVLTGREKETIIIKGANYYCHEIEETVMQIEGVEPSFTAACGVRRSGDREEKLAIFFAATPAFDGENLIPAIRSQVTNRYGISPSYVIPLKKHQIVKTTIGKIQRTRLKESLENGEFNDVIRKVDLILGNSNTVPAWFYRPIWIQKQAPVFEQRSKKGAVLILMDQSGLGEALAHQFHPQKRTCILVAPGSHFERKNEHSFTINSRSKEDFLKLFQELEAKHIAIDQIVSLIDYQSNHDLYNRAPGSETEDLSNLDAFLQLTQSILQLKSDKPIKSILWVTSDSQCVTPGDLGIASKAMMTGFTKSFHLEHPMVECKYIDLSTGNHSYNHRLLYEEMGAFSKEEIVAFRDGRRYVSRLENIDLIHSNWPSFELKNGGLYLITGGLGGLGYELARLLGRAYRAKLLILGRSPIEPGSDRPADSSDSSSDRRLKRLQTLIDEGIDCSYIQADVCDQQVVHELVSQAESRIQQSLDGIFHLAGIAHQIPVDQENVTGFAQLAAPKMQGSRVLGELIKARKGAFLIGFSSVNARFGGSNTAAYSAANNFLEAYCRQLSLMGFPSAYYAWSLWDGMGMSQDSSTNAIAEAKGFRAISVHQGLSSLSAALNSGVTEALIGLDANKTAIQIQLADTNYEQDSLLAFVEADITARESIPKSFPLQDRFGSAVQCRLEQIESLPLEASGEVDKNRLIALVSDQHQKKTKPTDEIESKLLGLWQELLQVQNIGTHDNFFELGGDSLLVVQLVALISKAFQTQMPASTVFHAPTIQKLAEVLREESTTPELFSIVPIRAGGSKQPLFIVQSDSWELVRYLDPEHPVYGLNYGVGAKTVEERLELPDRVEDLAAHYIREIKTIQPSGPYFLIGHSNAGLVTYEIAQQLLAGGEKLGLVGLIDTWHLPDRAGAPTSSMWDKMEKFTKLPLNEKLSYVQRIVRGRTRQLKLKFLTDQAEIPLWIRSMGMDKSYIPQPYPGQLAYFKCIKHSKLEPLGKDEEVWARLAQGGIQLHPIDCHHDEVLLEPHVELLAEQIKKYL